MDLIIEQVNAVWLARFGERSFPCAIGRSDVISAEEKHEGDGATPIGRWRMLRVLYRPDRVGTPETALPCKAITREDGWCDAPGDPHYNQQIVIPYGASHELLWRDDHLYDVIVVLDHNDSPAVPGRGSAIFLHIAKEGFSPTEGCVALAPPDLMSVLKEVDADSSVVVVR
jgi:L,D-peptidoglycan transpeptidase YkuD (ErfK/YbiS/YcfS/YnhG family)